MELEEMKNTWEELSKRIEKQELVTNQLIEKMTQQKYTSRLNKIGFAEYVGTIICYIGAAYLIMHFEKIEETLLQVFAVIAIVLLFVLPVISLKSIRALKMVNVSSQSYVETLTAFAKQKLKFQKLQKLNVALGFFLLLTVTPVLAAIQGKDLSQSPYFWTLIFPLSVLFFFGFAYWVLKSYNKLLAENEKMLTAISD